MKKLQIEYILADKLVPYINNPRINDKAVDQVAASIKEFGFKNPIIVDSENVIVAGHTRLLASRKLEMKEVPIIRAEDLTDKQIKAFRIADNKTSEFAEWDMELLEIEMEDLDNIFTGFDESEFNKLMGIEPEAEEDGFVQDLPEEPISQRGDMWELGTHRLYCGDSTGEDVGSLMGDQRADMVFTDPPWNVNYGAVEENNPMGYKPRTILNDFMGTEDFKKFMYDTFKNMNAYSKEGCMTYVVMSAQEWGNMMLALTDNEFHWSSTIIWNKDRLVMSRKDYHTKYEPIWYGWKEGASRLSPLEDRKQSDVWDIDRPSVSELHPTMKPIELVAKAIKNSSSQNDIVLDLFGGSGTTLIAADQMERTCYMMELDPKYVDVIVNRYIELVETDEEVFLIRDGEKIPYNKVK